MLESYCRLRSLVVNSNYELRYRTDTRDVYRQLIWHVDISANQRMSISPIAASIYDHISYTIYRQFKMASIYRQFKMAAMYNGNSKWHRYVSSSKWRRYISAIQNGGDIYRQFKKSVDISRQFNIAAIHRQFKMASIYTLQARFNFASQLCVNPAKLLFL